MIDFSKLPRPAETVKKTDPLEIFKSTPSLEGAPNDLWKGQAVALSEWDKHREELDILIRLNTGAGKSIIGALVAQSLVNEQIGAVVYCCSTIDLANQVSRECGRLGLAVTLRTGGKYSNNLFETEKAFCITTYQALFTPNPPFRNNLTPAAIIFDDAHVGERLVRDSLTLSIPRKEHGILYDEIVELLRPSFEEYNLSASFQNATNADSTIGTLMCPPVTGSRIHKTLIEIFKKYNINKHRDLLFPYLHLMDHIPFCGIYVNSRNIEFSPPFIPTTRFPFLQDGCRRVYLSATVDYVTDFVRSFGRLPSKIIAPDNDAGNGERLILIGSKIKDLKKEQEVSLGLQISKSNKVLVAVNSYNDAKRWAKLATPPSPEDFSEQLELFRSAGEGAFVLVSRYDGIDLPHNACRVMIIDDLPTGRSLMEDYLLNVAGLSDLLSTKMAVRIIQLFGRINRGRSDYGAFFVFGRRLCNWLSTDRNIALLPDLIRKQLLLGSTLQSSLGAETQNGAVSVVQQVLGRDDGWLEFYRETIDGLEVSDSVREKTRAREEKLAVAAVAECEFMSRLWESDLVGARTVLEGAIEMTAQTDPKLAGWHAIWLGLICSLQGDEESASAFYRQARAKVSRYLPVPPHRAIDGFDATREPISQFHNAMLSIASEPVGRLNDLIAELRVPIRLLRDSTLTADDHEDAFRRIGDKLGFGSSRPDHEHGSGPDNLWIDDVLKYSMGVELKTKKNDPATYYKKEIGQSYNHVQWVKDNCDCECDGIIILGPDGKCADDASPSEILFQFSPEEFCTRVEILIARLEDTRGRTVLERWGSINELGMAPEWNLKGWFSAMSIRKIKDL